MAKYARKAAWPGPDLLSLKQRHEHEHYIACTCFYGTEKVHDKAIILTESVGTAAI